MVCYVFPKVLLVTINQNKKYQRFRTQMVADGRLGGGWKRNSDGSPLVAPLSGWRRNGDGNHTVAPSVYGEIKRDFDYEVGVGLCKRYWVISVARDLSG
jgi:hypothetical protein